MVTTLLAPLPGVSCFGYCTTWFPVLDIVQHCSLFWILYNFVPCLDIVQHCSLFWILYNMSAMSAWCKPCHTSQLFNKQANLRVNHSFFDFPVCFHSKKCLPHRLIAFSALSCSLNPKTTWSDHEVNKVELSLLAE